MFRTEPGPEADETREDEATDAAVTEPATPVIDQDIEGSVNAALHDADERETETRARS